MSLCVAENPKVRLLLFNISPTAESIDFFSFPRLHHLINRRRWFSFSFLAQVFRQYWSSYGDNSYSTRSIPNLVRSVVRWSSDGGYTIYKKSQSKKYNCHLSESYQLSQWIFNTRLFVHDQCIFLWNKLLFKNLFG